MGVYIKDLVKPENCDICPIFLVFTTCGLDRDHCMFQEVPEPHGDMKDINHINQVLDRFSGYLDDDMIYRLKIAIGRDAPTIIPESKEAE